MMGIRRQLGSKACAWSFGLAAIAATSVPPAPLAPGEELLEVRCEAGIYGAGLRVAQRAEPKTLNPVIAVDAPSREVIRRMNADLISINRSSQRTEPALAKSWSASPDGRHYVLHLRKGIRFSDGQPFDADDVVFSFRVYLDENAHSPQRDLLLVHDQPLQVHKIDSHTVAFDLAGPYAAADRLFDSLAMLPRHLLEKTYSEGRIGKMWGLDADPGSMAGLGPFRLKQYRAGERLVLERNPYFWQQDSKGRRLPYLDEIDFTAAGSEDGQVARFMSGEADLVNRVGAKNFELLRKEENTRHQQLSDLGPGLEYTFLFFNLDDASQHRAWFDKKEFRRAVSEAIDRASIVRLAYGGKAAILPGHVTPGNLHWQNQDLPQPVRSVERARATLRASGFSWDASGNLLDPASKAVEFSIISSAGNSERVQTATIIQDDLKQLGMQVQVVPLEFRTFVDRVTNNRQFDAAILSLGGGDADPNSEMNVWISSGGMHVWKPNQKQPASGWESEMDRLMKEQMITLVAKKRKALYDRVQQIVADELPVICLVSPHVLVAARQSVGNFHPAILDHYTLWNAATLFIRPAGNGAL